MHPSLLQNISQPRDLKRLSSAQIQQLCGEIRQFLLDSVSKTGGHLASITLTNPWIQYLISIRIQNRK